jgi:hypothetical protein
LILLLNVAVVFEIDYFGVVLVFVKRHDVKKNGGRDSD